MSLPSFLAQLLNGLAGAASLFLVAAGLTLVLLVHQFALLPGNMLAHDIEDLQRRREHDHSRRHTDQQFCKAGAVHARKS